MSTTIAEIADRVRSILVASPFEYGESQSPFDFSQQPDGTIDKCFRLVNGGSNRVVAQFNFAETRIDRLVIYVARKFAGEPVLAERLLTRDMGSIVAAICRDGESVSGEYCLEDGRSHIVRAEPGAEFAVMELTVPVNYETTL